MMTENVQKYWILAIILKRFLSCPVVLLQMDISALMGYRGALFREFLGTGWGIAFAAGVLLLWATLPMLWAVRIFRKKDL